MQIAAGSLVLAGLALAYLVSPWFLALSAIVGTGLVFARHVRLVRHGEDAGPDALEQGVFLMMAADALTFGSGSLVGFALGLLGGGGSILAVPLLIYVVGLKNTHVAIGTSALGVSANAFANLIPHARAGNVKWPCAAVFALAGIAGAAAGALLAGLVDWRVAGVFVLGGIVGGLLGVRLSARLSQQRGALSRTFAVVVVFVAAFVLWKSSGGIVR